MILFLKDWVNSGAMVHTTTKNKSFIDLAHVLKKMGVKNHFFFLALYDKRLLDIDPFDENLTQEQKLWVAAECSRNIWYYLRECAPVPEGDKTNRFKANRANIALIWSFLNNCTFLLIQPRQTGKSYSTDTLMVYLMNFGTGVRTLLYTLNLNLAGKNIVRLKKLFDRMPAYLDLRTKKDANNQSSITVLERSNYYNITVADNSVEEADKKGRGFTVEVRHGDEVAYCPNNWITLGVIGSAMNAAKEDALREGRYTGSIFTTTAGKKDSPHGAWCYEMVEEYADWDDVFFYDSEDKYEFEQRVRSRSNPKSELAKRNGVFGIHATFSHRQLGKTDEWLINNITENRVGPEEALRDYYNVWTSGNEISPFTTKQLQMISGSEVEPEWMDAGPNGLTIKWYHDPDTVEYLMQTRPIIVGMDSSFNVGKDSTTLTFVDATNLDIVGTASCNDINLYSYSKWLAELLIKYENILIIPENKSSGQGIIDYLLEVLPNHGIDPFKRLFNVVVNEKEINLRRFENVDRHPSRMTVANQYRPLFGYSTTGAGRYSRNNLYNETLFRVIAYSADKIKDAKLINELLGLVMLDGRVDHQKGKHDDQVISWLLACWFIFNAREVYYYDIIKQKFLSSIVQAGKVVDTEELIFKREQELLKEKIENLYNELSSTTDYFEFSKLERDIRNLESKLKSTGVSTDVSMSGMIDELKENRKLDLMKDSPDIINNILGSLDEVSMLREVPTQPKFFTHNQRVMQALGNTEVYTHKHISIDSLEYWMT